MKTNVLFLPSTSPQFPASIDAYGIHSTMNPLSVSINTNFEPLLTGLQGICEGDESITSTEDWTAALKMKETLDAMFE